MKCDHKFCSQWWWPFHLITSAFDLSIYLLIGIYLRTSWYLIFFFFWGTVLLTGCVLAEIQVLNEKVQFYSTATEHLHIVKESLQSKPLKSPLFSQWSSGVSKQGLYSARVVRVVFGPFSCVLWSYITHSLEWTNLKTPVIIVKFCDLTSTF